MDKESNKLPQWVSGHYKHMMGEGEKVSGACIVDGHQAVVYSKSFNDAKGTMTWVLGNFGEANEAIMKATGQKNYNIKITSPELTGATGEESIYGVIEENG